MFSHNQDIHNNGAFRLCARASGREVLIAVIFINIHVFCSYHTLTWINVFPHPACSQTKGRSPVCIRICRARSLRRVNVLRQPSRSQVCKIGTRSFSLIFLAFLGEGNGSIGSPDVEATGCGCDCAGGVTGGAGIFSKGLAWVGVDSADAITVGEEVDEFVIMTAVLGRGSGVVTGGVSTMGGGLECEITGDESDGESPAA